MSVFISIAALNEGMLERTCREALAAADGDVRIGVCLQGAGEVPDDDRIVVHREPHPVGMARGRWIATGFYDAEDYWFSIDGHMYDWQPGWDTTLIRQLKRLGPNAALTSFPPDDSVGALSDVDRIMTYRPEGTMRRLQHRSQRDVNADFQTGRYLPVSIEWLPLRRDMPMPYAIGPCLFTWGRFAEEARPDPLVHEDAEEQVMSLRLWTRGVDFYHPDRHVFRHANKNKRGHMPVKPRPTDEQEARAKAYFEGDPPEGMLGDARTRQEYLDFFFGAGWLDSGPRRLESPRFIEEAPVVQNGIALHAHEKPPMRSRHVRKQENLPEDGRAAAEDIERLESVLFAAMAPDVPSYDVSSVQDTNFDEWCYTEGLGCLMVFTQSVEINARLMSEVVAWEGGLPMEGAPADRIAKSLGDKWVGSVQSDMLPHAPKLYTFFPPGNNLIGQLVNVDNVLRAFDTDGRWMMKPHPISNDECVADMRRTFGATRVYSRKASGMEILRRSAVVGHTTATEMGLMALLLQRKTVDFSLYERESRGRYHPLYRAIRESPVLPHNAIKRMMDCPFSGVIPLDTSDEEAEDRIRQYKRRTLALRDSIRPMVRQRPVSLGRK